jgi:hypothetical protein
MRDAFDNMDNFIFMAVRLKEFLRGNFQKSVSRSQFGDEPVYQRKNGGDLVSSAFY